MAQDINNFIDPKLIENLTKLNEQIILAGTNIDKLLPSIKKFETTQKGISAAAKQTNNERKKLTEAEKEAAKITKQLETTESKLLSLQKGQQDALIKTKTELQKNTKATKDLQRAQSAQRGSTEQLSAVNAILEKRLKGVNQTTDKGKRSADLLRSAIDKNNTKIKQQSSALTKQKINVGNYRNSLEGLTVKVKDLTQQQRNLDISTKKGRKEFAQLNIKIKNTNSTINKYKSSVRNANSTTNKFGSGIKGTAMKFAGALGLTSAVFMFINVLKGAFNTIREFTKENAVLAGVLGKTRKEVKELTNQAIQLGSVYPVTASEVVKLQVSYARLGFTMSEIKDLTEATILGSIALNSSLDETATLVGATVKAFDALGTADAGKIMDILTLGTQKTSQSFETLKTALPKVAAAANAMGFSLETVIDQLGTAQDATLDASISGTSLRNIYLELANRGITLDEALTQINQSSNRLSTSFELFGKRSAIVGLALAKTQGQTTEFGKAVGEVGGVTKRVAEEQMKTLDGAIKGLGSSWEKFVTGFKKSEGILSKVINSVSLAIDTLSNRDIPLWKKNIELLTLGIVNLASAEQKKIAAFSNEIKNASVKDLQYTIDKHEKELKEGNRVDKILLDMLKNRLQKQKIIDIKAAQDKAARDELANNNLMLEQLGFENDLKVLFKDGATKQIEETNQKYDALIKRAKNYGLDTSQLEQKRKDEIKNINKDAEDKITKNAKEESDKRIKIWVDETLRRASIKQAEIDTQTKIEDSFADVIKGEVDEENKALTKKVNDSIKAGEKISQDTADLKQKERDNELEAELEAEQLKVELKQAIQEGAFEAAGMIGDAITDRRVANIQKEFDVLEMQKEAELSNANLTAQQKQAIEEKYAKKAAELKTKQAKAEKEGAIFTALINIAQAVIKSIAGSPLTFGLPFSAIAAALGAIQLGVIVSQPIPQFEKGIDYAPGGVSELAEKGRELVENPSGKVWMAENRGLYNLDRGSKVLTNRETENVLNDARMVNGLARIEKAIEKQPTFIMDAEYRVIGRQSNSHREIYVNRLKYGK